MAEDADTTGRVAAVLDTVGDLGRRCDRKLKEYLANCAKLRTLLEQDRGKRLDSIPPSVGRVLVVDDDPNCLKSMVRVLRHLSPPAFVDTASSVELANAKIMDARAMYHVLVLDYQLTNGDASAIIRVARRKWPLCWVVLISAHLSAHSGPRMARAIDANDWLAKDFNIEDLIYVVSKGLGNFDDPYDPPPPPPVAPPEPSGTTYRMLDIKKRRR